MFVLLMISWWYGRGWLWILTLSLERLKTVNETFSVGMLLRTLFSPWKQIQTAKTFQNFLQSSVDNFISRFIGASVRLVMLFTAFVLSLLIIIFGLALFIIWPLIPLLVIALPIISLKAAGA
jgi:hypothetical protein